MAEEVISSQTPTTNNPPALKKKRNLPRNPAEMKNRASQLLLENSKDGQLAKGKIQEISLKCGMSRRTLSTIWAATKSNIQKGQSVIFKAPKWSTHRDATKLDIQKFKSLPFRKRSTYRRIAREMGVSKSTVGIWFKMGLIRAHTNAIKPDLTAQNKLIRLTFCVSSLQYDATLNNVKFKSMHNTIHIDEKWFYITKENERYYLLPGEIEPYRSCKSKRFITKLMFMCAVARPQYAINGDLIFDGKIGLFPFTKQEPAKRNSKNRLKGTLETKPIETINKEFIKNCLINQIIPAIKEKWPANATRNIFIQQDNARPHINDNDIDFRAAASSDGYNIHLVCQPANSPDTNINDLGFFRAIQSLQDETKSYSVDDLLQNVMLSYDKLTHITLNKVFLSLQNCMIEIMKCKGHNSYKLPHMYKERLIREEILPECIQVDELLLKECIDYLRQPENQIVCSYDVESLVADLRWLA